MNKDIIKSMNVTTYPKKVTNKKSSLILGAFEILHIGHLKLINEAKKEKRPITMMLIDDPSKLPKSIRKNMTDLNTRLQHLAKLGVSNVIVVNLTQDLLNTNGKTFMEKIILSTNAHKVFVGKDFALGKNRNYSAKMMSQDWDVQIIEHKKENGAKISSSILAEMIELGDFDIYKKYALFPYQVTLNFNSVKKVQNFDFILIHPGIYAVTVIVNSICYWGSMHIKQNFDMKLFVPDLQIKNRPFKATITFYKSIRKIIASKYDELTEHDKQLAGSYLLAL